ncbi:IclR family transcriptional regulator [Pararhizobium sp. DWP3-4]|uniref:IclR family transcriptional regulator n=1 Tax=Pararhizobium sp. DWP3-4 TaxID=2804565 RepID=UPI003CE7CFB6
MPDVRKPIRSVLRAAAVIKAIGAGTKGITAIAAEVGVSKGTVFDLVKTLESVGFVSQSRTGDDYQLGPVLMRLASTGLSQVDLVAVAAPHLQELANETGEVCHLGRRDGFAITYLHRAKSQHLSRMLELSSLVGARSPLHCTSMGKIILAQMNPEEFEDYLAIPREKFTERTLTNATDLVAECGVVRAQRFALNIGEYEEGVSSVAVPLNVSAGVPHHGINFAVPSARMSRSAIPELVQQLQRTAEAIQKDLGS